MTIFTYMRYRSVRTLPSPYPVLFATWRAATTERQELDGGGSYGSFTFAG